MKEKEKRIEYQEGILPNLLSGFYEQVSKDKRDASLMAIFKSLREEFEKSQKRIEELEKELKS